MTDEPSFLWPLLAGVAFGVVALGLVGAASLASGYDIGWNGGGLTPATTAVAGVVAAACWYAVVERSADESNRRRGAAAGALVGLLGPWAFFAGWSLVRNGAVLAADPFERLGVALLVGPVTLVDIAPLTLPLGTATGYLLGRVRTAEPRGGAGA
jgi:hypothetical protein